MVIVEKKVELVAGKAYSLVGLAHSTILFSFFLVSIKRPEAKSGRDNNNGVLRACYDGIRLT